MARRPQLGQRRLEAVGGEALDRGVGAHRAGSIGIEPAHPPGGSRMSGSGVAQLLLPPCGKLRPRRGEALLNLLGLGLREGQTVLVGGLHQAAQAPARRACRS